MLGGACISTTPSWWLLSAHRHTPADVSEARDCWCQSFIYSRPRSLKSFLYPFYLIGLPHHILDRASRLSRAFTPLPSMDAEQRHSEEKQRSALDNGWAPPPFLGDGRGWEFRGRSRAAEASTGTNGELQPKRKHRAWGSPGFGDGGRGVRRRRKKRKQVMGVVQRG